MTTIRTVDETTAGGRTEGPVLELEGTDFTVRDLISLRVREEVRRYNNRPTGRYYGLVQPTDLETMLNGPTEGKVRQIDADAQVATALQAFKKQQVLVLLPDRQAMDLDEPVALSDGDEVGFLRLVPLVGG